MISFGLAPSFSGIVKQKTIDELLAGVSGQVTLLLRCFTGGLKTMVNCKGCGVPEAFQTLRPG